MQKSGYLVLMYLCIWYFITIFTFAPDNFIYFFGSLSLKLVYFAAPNWLGQNFSVNFNYQRCLENSQIIRFGLTSWVTSCWQIFINFYGAIHEKVIKSVRLKLPNLSTQNWSCWSFPGIFGSWSLPENSDPSPLVVKSRLTSSWQLQKSL